MKIGILTFHRAVNYGAFLQCYSLCSALKRRFPTTTIEVIDYFPVTEQRKINKNILRELKKRGLSAAYAELRKKAIFRESVKQLPLSEKRFFDDDFSALFQWINTTYDFVIVGSDAVLNWTQNGYPSAFYLDEKLTVPTAMYAASVHGMDYRSMSSEEREYCKTKLSAFCLLGLRDTNTEQFVTEFFPDGEIFHCCDPTCFLEIPWLQECRDAITTRILKKYGLDLRKPYIAEMQLNPTVSRILREKFGDRYQIAALFKKDKLADAFLYDLTPFEWAAVLSGAALTVTQYFHGALVSLRYETPTIVLDAAGSDVYESKLFDLICKRLNLSYIYSPIDCACKREAGIWNTAEILCGNREEGKKLSCAVESEAKASERFFDRMSNFLILDDSK